MAAGKVLLESLTIKTLSCTGCSQQSEGVKLSLLGERTVEFKNGYTCNSSVETALDHKDVEDFGSGGLAKFDGASVLEQNMMGDCFKVECFTGMKVLIGNPHFSAHQQEKFSFFCMCLHHHQ